MTMPRTKDGIPVIDDRSCLDVVKEAQTDTWKGRGLIPRDFEQEPFGSLPFAAPFNLPVIPREEWKERIAEKERTQSGLSHLCDLMGVEVKNQGRTNYCWINAPVHCVEIVRAQQGQPYVELSPASCGAIIKNFQNVGGWGTEGVRYLAEHGAVPTSLWPSNAIDRRYDTPEANAQRAKFQVDEWLELRPRSFEQLVTCVLLNIPVAIGLNWWRHEVTAIDAVVHDGRVGILINNSWGKNWGRNGRSVLTESKATPDDAIAPKVVTASGA